MITLLLTLALSQTVQIRNEGAPSGRPAGALNCVGAGIDCTGPTVNGGTATVTVTGGGAVGYQTVRDEGDPLTQRTIVNFLGVLVSCVDNAGTGVSDCTVSAPSFAQVSGTATPAQLGTGTPDVSKFLRGDGVWATPPQPAPPPVVGALPAPAALKPLRPPTSNPLQKLLPCSSIRRTNCR